MKIVVIGNGALGIGLSAKLIEAGYSPAVLGRRGSLAIQATVSGMELDISQIRSDDLSRMDLAFVAVKAFDFKDALLTHVMRLPAGIPIIPIGNGAILHELSAISKKFPRAIFRLGVSTLAVSKIGPLAYELKNPQAIVQWGPYLPQESTPLPAEQELLRANSALFRWTDNPASAFRSKWLFNTTLNSLLAVKGCATNGEALNHREELEEVFDEAYALGRGLWGDWQESHESLFEKMMMLIHATAGNENSMVADRKAGRKTESDYLAGMAVRFEGLPRLKALHQQLS